MNKLPVAKRVQILSMLCAGLVDAVDKLRHCRSLVRIAAFAFDLYT
jgi:hypothetical protein